MSNYRYMRSLLMFDLPSVTNKEKREYRKFVKFLIKNGFIMFQESIYVKLSINSSKVKSIEALIKSNLPPAGMVSMLTVTENQFNSMTYFLGNFTSDIENSDKRFIEL